MSDYWQQQNLEAVAAAGSWNEVGGIALEVFSRVPDPISYLTGPVSTGGYENVHKNLYAYSKTFEGLVGEGKTLFDIVRPVEAAVIKLKKLPGMCTSDLSPLGLNGRFAGNLKPYPVGLLLDVYLPVFEEGRFKEWYLMDGWDCSVGSSWEQLQADRFGVKQVYLERGYGLRKEDKELLALPDAEFLKHVA